MGYYNNMEVEKQEEVDRVIRWYNNHHAIVPSYLMRLIMDDNAFATKVVNAWEKIELSTVETPSPKPASEHVALQHITNGMVR